MSSERVEPAAPPSELPTEPLFLDFFYLLRRKGLPVTTREWLTFMEALAQGLVAANLHRMYAIARATLVKNERHYDLFDRCFAYYFGDADAPDGLKDALDEWLQDPRPMPTLSAEDLAALRRYGLDELRRMFEERLKEQTERHDGGSRWVGTGGTSPFGHGGVHPGGVRVGGVGGGKTAVQIAAERRFAEYRSDLVLDVRQLSLALRKLRRLGRQGVADEIDLDATIHATAHNMGDLEIVMRPPRANRLKLLLLMDVGGSMDPFAHLVSKLFSAAHGASHFHEFHAFYFHNCIYGSVYRHGRLRDTMSTAELMRWLGKDTRVIYLGDAHMAPYELIAQYGAIDYDTQNQESGITWLRRLGAHFSHQVWLNPIERAYWSHPTIQLIQDTVPMFELTLDGLERAVDTLVQ